MTFRSPAASAVRNSLRRLTGQRPNVGCRRIRPPVSALAAMAMPVRSAASRSRAARSAGGKGVSTAAVTTAPAPMSAAQSSAARMPASGPG